MASCTLPHAIAARSVLVPAKTFTMSASFGQKRPDSGSVACAFMAFFTWSRSKRSQPAHQTFRTKLLQSCR